MSAPVPLTGGLGYVRSAREHVAQLQRVAGILELAAEVDPVNGPAAAVRAAELRAEAALESGTFAEPTSTPVAEQSAAECAGRVSQRLPTLVEAEAGEDAWCWA